MDSNNHLLDVSAGTNTIPWDLLGLAGLAFLIVVAGLARMGYIPGRRLALLCAVGSIYLLGTLFAQTSHQNTLAQREMDSVNTQLADAWPQVAKLSGGLLHATPEAGEAITVIDARGVECNLVFADADQSQQLSASMSCGGQHIAPLATTSWD